MIPSGIFDRGKSLRLVTEILRDQKEHLWPTSQGDAKVEVGASQTATLSSAPLCKGDLTLALVSRAQGGLHLRPQRIVTIVSEAP
jgi:hypothetical protein